jgi:prepilin-type N-terminal cleavage/methylation domain-containing protein
MRRLLRHLARDERGFTLSEMLVVLIFLAMIAAAFSMLFSATIRHNSEITEQSVTQGELRAAVDRMMSEARGAYVGDGTPAITAAGSSQVTFTFPDKLNPFHLVRVSYRVNGGNLQRAFERSTNTDGPPWTFAVGGTPSNWATYVPNVTSATPFSYYDVSGATTATLANIHSFQAALTIATKSGGGRTYAYSTRVSTRTTE